MDTVENDYSSLHLAVKSGNRDAVKVLVDYRANVNAKTRNGFTPLNLAKDLEIRKLLS